MTPSPRPVPGSAGPAPGPTPAGPASAATVPATRLPASLVPSVQGMRLSPPDTEVTLVNISATGALVQCDHRFTTGSDVMVAFVGTLEPSSVPGRIVRCAVASIGEDGLLKYHVGVAFRRRIELDEAPMLAVRHPAASRQGPSPAPPSAGLRNRW
jgi:hypothetical protein